MPKQNLTKHTFRLKAGQVETLAELHPSLTVNEVMRRIIDAYIARAQRQLGSTQTKVKVDVEV